MSGSLFDVRALQSPIGLPLQPLYFSESVGNVATTLCRRLEYQGVDVQGHREALAQTLASAEAEMEDVSAHIEGMKVMRPVKKGQSLKVCTALGAWDMAAFGDTVFFSK